MYTGRLGMLSAQEVEVVLTAYLHLKQLLQRALSRTRQHATEREHEEGCVTIGRELFGEVAEMHRACVQMIDDAAHVLSR